MTLFYFQIRDTQATEMILKPVHIFPLLQGIHRITIKREIQASLKTCHDFFFLFAYFWRLLLQQLHLKIAEGESTSLLSPENSKLLLCPVYLIDSQHLSGTQSISLSLPLHHSHFWQLNTRSKSSVTQTYDTVNLCNTVTLETAALKAKQKWDLGF